MEQRVSMNNDFSQQELTRTLEDAGYKRLLVGVEGSPNQSIMKGDVRFDTLPSGLRVHCTDTLEKSTGELVPEIDPMLSLNFLMQGTIRFGLNETQYEFSAKNGPVTFINLITKPSIFRRTFTAGMKIKKLNISVDESWLLARCNRTEDQALIERLFKLNTRTFNWQSSEIALQKINKLLCLREKPDLMSAMEAEQTAFSLFIDCYQQLEQDAKSIPQEGAGLDSTVESHSGRYEDKITELILESFTLDELAQKLGASISTLQRHFKKVHKVTLKQYVRNQKLELARRLLIFDKKTIGEVAYIAGYNHSSNFIKAFKSYFDITPAELQKKY